MDAAKRSFAPMPLLVEPAWICEAAYNLKEKMIVNKNLLLARCARSSGGKGGGGWRKGFEPYLETLRGNS